MANEIWKACPWDDNMAICNWTTDFIALISNFSGDRDDFAEDFPMGKFFLDAYSHLYVRVCPSCVRPSVCPSVSIKENPPISACETHRITRLGLFYQ